MKNNSEVMEIVTEKMIKIVENIESEIPKNQYKRILMCINDEIMKQEGKIKKKFDCKSRYCPVCSDKLKKREREKIRKKLQEIKEKNYLLMTLNGNNVTEDKLKHEIEDNNRAFISLMRLDLFKRTVTGYIKAVEITYINEKSTYLPHLHVILVVKGGYRKYMKLNTDKEKIKKQWNKHKKSHDLFMDIQSVRDIDKVMSYLTVSQKKRYTEIGQEELKGIIRAIRNKKRLYSYGGILSKK
jgi:plasmid rolling circle replication initiator protein Rep